MKNIVVCMKQVLDPEIPLSLFHVDEEAKRAIQPKASPPVLSPFDENALEAALRIKDAQEATVTVISLGKKLTRAVVTSALAAGADQLVLLQDQLFDEFNTNLTAEAIAAAIRKLGDYDLILCGLQAADTNAGQVSIGIAHFLNVPCIIEAHHVELLDDKVRVKKPSVEGYEIIEAPSPVVVTVSYEVGALREPGVEAFMSASQKPITTWDIQELKLENDGTDMFIINRMEEPSQGNNCEIIDGTGFEEKVARLVTRLKETKVL
jgi:electron transfer flavoprotein beta subunit